VLMNGMDEKTSAEKDSEVNDRLLLIPQAGTQSSSHLSEGSIEIRRGFTRGPHHTSLKSGKISSLCIRSVLNLNLRMKLTGLSLGT